MGQATDDSHVYRAHLATPPPAKAQQHSLTALRWRHCTNMGCHLAVLLVPWPHQFVYPLYLALVVSRLISCHWQCSESACRPWSDWLSQLLELL